MKIADCFRKSLTENKKVKRFHWQTWHDLKTIYLSYADVLAEDWEVKEEKVTYWVGVDTVGNLSTSATEPPRDSELKWVEVVPVKKD